MDMDSLKKELIWFGSLLIVLIVFLMIVGFPEYSELAIATTAFAINWLIVSYSVKRFGVGSMDTDSLKKELIWFGGLLIVLIVFLMIVGSVEYSELAIATTAFTLIWFIRSYLVKRYAVAEQRMNGAE